MAFKDGDSKNLSSLAEHFDKKISDIKLPGGDNSDKEIVYSEMDMIAGICSAALFGAQGQDRNKVKTLINTPQKSHLYSINNILQALSGKNPKAIISNGAVKVKIIDIASKSMTNLLKSISNIDGNKKSKSQAKIDINLNGITNINELNKALIELTENTNSKYLSDGINGLTTIINELNNLSNVDISKIINAFENIQKMNIDFVALDNSLKIDESIKHSIEESCQSLSNIISNINTFINNIPKEISDNILINEDNKLKNIVINLKGIINEFNSDDFKNFDQTFSDINFNDIFRSILKFDEKYVHDNLDNLKNKLTELHTYLQNSNKETGNVSIKDIFDDIADLAKSAKIEEDSNIKILSNMLSVVLDLISTDIKVNAPGLIKIRSLTKENGIIEQILNDIRRIGSPEINKNISESFNIIGSYFNSIEKMTDIGLFGRLRIKSNLKFIKNVINKQLPNLINDINKNFENVDVKEIKGLQNLTEFFSFISKLGELSIKSKRKMYSNLEFIRMFIVNDIVELINEINTNIQSVSDEIDFKEFSNLFDTIIKIIDIDSTKISKAEDSLEDLYDLLFDEDLSLISIFKKLNEQVTYNPATITNLETSCDQLFTFVNNIKLDDDAIQEFINLGSLLRFMELPLLNSIMKYLNEKIVVTNDTADKIEAIKTTYFDPLIQLNREITSSNLIFADLAKVFNSIIELNKNIELIVKNNKLLNIFKEVLEKEADAIQTFVNKFDNINSDNVKLAIDIVQELSKLIMFSTAILIIGSLAMTLIDITNLLTFTAVLTFFIYSMSYIAGYIAKNFDNKNLNQVSDILEELRNLILYSSAILIIGSLAMSIINPLNLFAFTGTLGIFLWGMTKVISILQSLTNIEEINKIAIQFGKLVFICGMTLAFGSLITSLVSFGDLISFAVNLAAFMAMLYLPLWLFSKIEDEIIKSAKDFGILVMICGATLALGSLITQSLHWKDILAFGVYLSLFMTMLAGPLFLFSLAKKSLFKNAKDFGNLILICAATLILGAFFMKTGLGWQALGFAVILSLFMLGISAALGIGSWIAGKKALKFGYELAALVAICAFALTLGPILIHKYLNGNYWEVLGFAAILGLFVAGITIAIAFAGKMLRNKGLAIALGLSLIITISAMALILGPIILKKYEISYTDVLLFGVMVLGFVSLFGVVLGIMGIFAPQIGLGLLCAAGIGILTFGLAWVILESHRMLSQIDWDDFWTEWKNVGELFLIIGGVTAILGGIMMTGIGAVVMAAGAAALATFEGLIWGLGKCVEAAAHGIKKLKDVQGIDVKELMTPFGDFLKYGFSAVWDNVTLKQAGFLKMVKSSIQGLVSIIGDIATVIKEYAELKVAVYDNKGKLIGYRNLDNTDFQNAATNIAAIITLVGGSIMSLFGIGPLAQNISNDQKEIAKEMLKVEPGGLFRSRKTKFGMIVEATAGLGKVIKEIVEGALKYTKLPPDFDGDKIATNIATIISCVGGSIMGLFGVGQYANNVSNDQQKIIKEMMKVSPGGIFRSRKTKFGLILESTAGLGKVIKEISEGALKYSELPPNFNPTTISTNIQTIIETLGTAIITTYDKHKDMFETSFWSGKNKFGKVINSVNKLGLMISMLMLGIQSYANLKIPIDWNSDGKPIKWKPMTHVDFILAKHNISKLIIALGDAVATVADKQEFKNIYNGNNLKIITEAIANITSVLSPIAESIWMYSQGIFPKITYKNGKLENVGWFDSHGDVQGVINSATSNIGIMLCGLADEFVKILKNSKYNSIVSNNSKIKVLSESLSIISSTIKSVFEIISKIIDKQITVNKVQTLINNPFNKYINTVLLQSATNTNSNVDILNWLCKDTEKTENYVKSLKSISNAILTLFENLSKIVKLENINQQSIIDNITNPFNTFIENIFWKNTNDIKWYIKENYDDIKKTYLNSLLDLSKIMVKVFFNINTIASYTNITQNNIKEKITSLVMLLQLIPVVKEYIEMYSLEVSNNLNKFKSDLQSLITVISSINGNIDTNTNKVFNSISVLWNAITLLDKYIENKSLNVNQFFTDLQKYVELIKNDIQEDFNNKSNVLKNSITELFEIVSNINNNEDFAKHTETLKKYVETINSIDVTKVKSMTELADSVTELGNKIGNIDNFAEALAGSISETLQVLSIQIQNASTIIQNADQLHKKRENSIKNSIEKITELMDKEMVVKISEETNENKDKKPSDSGDSGKGNEQRSNSSTTTTTTSSNSSTGTVSIPKIQSFQDNLGTNVTVEINERALATAIVLALKESGLINN